MKKTNKHKTLLQSYLLLITYTRCVA